MKNRIGLLAFSFGSDLKENEPSNCNLRLCLAVQEIVLAEREKGNEVITVVQWEIGQNGIPDTTIAKVIDEPGPDVVTDSSWVVDEATPIFHQNGITDVIVVANQFLHRFSCFRLVQKAGFRPVKRRHMWIGFYPQSRTWWTRGPIHLLVYAFCQALFGYRGNYHSQ